MANGKELSVNEAELMANGLSLRTNATLRDDDWKRFDAELLENTRNNRIFSNKYLN